MFRAGSIGKAMSVYGDILGSDSAIESVKFPSGHSKKVKKKQVKLIPII